MSRTAIRIDIEAIPNGPDILRSLSATEWRVIPPGLRKGRFELRRYGLIEETSGHRYRLTILGADHTMALEPVLTRPQRLARALCASGRIDTGDGVCAGVCEARGSGVCPHVLEVHEMWATALLQECGV